MRYLFILLCFIPVLCNAAQHIIDDNSDLPYTVSVNYDTVTIVTDGLVAAGRILTVNGGVTGAYIKADHLTTYGANVDQGTGRLFMILDGGTNTTIENWKIRQVYPAVNDSVQAIRIGSSIGHHYDSVSVYVCGYESQGIYTDGAGGINVEYGNWASSCPGFYSRYEFYASIMWFNDNSHVGAYSDGTNIIEDDIPYRIRVYGITIDSCPFGGIIIRGNGIYVVDSNTINLQTHNDRYGSGGIPSTADWMGAANCFGIAAGRNVPSHGGYYSYITRNTIRVLGAGTTRAREGGNGIATGGSYLDYPGSARVHDNDIITSQGPDDYYVYNIPSQAFKCEDLLDTLFLYDNYFETSADIDVATTDINYKANTVWLAEAGDNAYWRIYNNQIITNTAGRNSSYTEAYAIALEVDMTPITTNILFENNYISSNCVAIKYGSMNGFPSSNISFDKDEIVITSPIYNNMSGVSGSVFFNDNSFNNVFTDVLLADTVLDMSGDCSFSIRKRFNITVLGSNGAPVEGASVTVLNNYGQVVLSDSYTNESGVTDTTIGTVKYIHSIDVDSLAFSNFTMAVSYGSDYTEELKSFRVTTNGFDTLILSNTIGGYKVGTRQLLEAGYPTDANSGPHLTVPRYINGVMNNNIFAFPKGNIANSDWFYSTDSGLTYTAVDNGGTTFWGQKTDYHQGIWAQDGVGIDVVAPTASGFAYRFIASPATSWSDVGPLRILRAATCRGVVYSRGDTTWAAVRQIGDGSHMYIYVSLDHFATVTWSYTMNMESGCTDTRVMLYPDDNGLVSLFILQFYRGYRYYQWGGTASGFTVGTDNVIVTGEYDYGERAMSINYLPATGFHVVFGSVKNFPRYLADYYKNPSGVWTRHNITYTPNLADGLSYFPTLLRYKDSLFVIYSTLIQNNCNAVGKWFDPVTSLWDTDSLPLSGTDIIYQYTSSLPRIPDTWSSFPIFYTTTDGNNWAVSIDMNNAAEEPTNTAPIVSDIPNQTVDQDEYFVTILLDNYVTDDQSITNLVWTYSGNTNLSVSIVNRIATITFDPSWSGIETVTFTATDSGSLYDSDDVVFTVNDITPPEAPALRFKGWKP